MHFWTLNPKFCHYTVLTLLLCFSFSGSSAGSHKLLHKTDRGKWPEVHWIFPCEKHATKQRVYCVSLTTREKKIRSWVKFPALWVSRWKIHLPSSFLFSFFFNDLRRFSHIAQVGLELRRGWPWNTNLPASVLGSTTVLGLMDDTKLAP